MLEVTMTTAITTTQPKLNKPLLRDVKRHILAEPRRLDMDLWTRDASYMTTLLRPACKTTACIAGWTGMLAIKRAFPKRSFRYIAYHDTQLFDSAVVRLGLVAETAPATFSPNSRAQFLLGITESEARVLFHVSAWPEPYQTQYNNANMVINSYRIRLDDGKQITAQGKRDLKQALRKRARVAAARIDYFIRNRE